MIKLIKNKKELEPVYQDRTDELATVEWQKRADDEDQTILLKNRASQLDKIRDQIRLLHKEVESEKWKLIQRRAEYDCKVSVLERELQGEEVRQNSLMDTIALMTKEIEAFEKPVSLEILSWLCGESC